MLQFGSISTGGGGNTLWKFVGGTAPDNIDLDTAAGVTGINATNPSLFNYKMIFGSFAGIVASVWGYFKGTKEAVVGLLDLPSYVTATLSFYDSATGDVALVESTDLFQTIVGAGDAINQAYVITDKISISEQVGNVVTNNRIERNENENAWTFRVVVGGNAVLNTGADANGFIVTDGTNQRFRIKPNGNIQTDQTTAAALKVPNGNYIEVFDMAGASQGFIQLTT